MKLQEALEMAAVCGLHTVGEAWLNVRLHATSIFPYEIIEEELAELWTDIYSAYGEKGENGWKAVLIPQEIIDEEERKMGEYFNSVDSAISELINVTNEEK